MFVIPDNKRPIVIPFGYACVGKTMLIIRLIRYLRTIGYVIHPELVFRNDPIYPKICEMYMDEVHGNNVAVGTAANGTILLNILDKKGSPICYVLDIAGEYQHDLNNPLMELSPEMDYIINSPNPKIWSFIIDIQSNLNLQERSHYVQKIHGVGSFIRKYDKVAFIASKVDCSNFILNYNRVSTPDLYRYIEIQYPKLFTPFIKVHPILKFITKQRFVFIPFVSGNFYVAHSGVQCFTPSDDTYPKQLWSNLVKLMH